MSERHTQEIKALLWERLGYERRGLEDRVAQIDALLAQLDYHAEDPVTVETAAVAPEVERAVMKRVTRKKKVARGDN